MAKIHQQHSCRTSGIHPYWVDLPLLHRLRLDSKLEVTTLVEVEGPSSHSQPFMIEVIDESPLPHFNPPLHDTLDHVL